MYIVIPRGSTFTATIAGNVVRDVKCENCGCDYVYIVSAVARGSSTSPMFIDQAGAAAAARGRAIQEMQRQLRQSYLIVHCPDCGWYQQRMVQMLRERRLLKWGIVVALPIVWLGLTWIFASSDEPTDLHVGLWLGIAGALAVVAMIFHLTWQDNLNHPNRAERDKKSGKGIGMRKADFEKLKAEQETTAVQSNDQ